MKSFLLALSVITIFLHTGCNNNSSQEEEKNPAATNTILKEEESIEGSGYLQLALKVNGEPMQTDSARYTAHDIDGLRLEAWGQRLTSGEYAYTYTLEMRIHSFRGKGSYPLTGEYGNMFWQYKSFYIQPAAPGSFITDNWDTEKISGQFEFIADDNYGDKRRVEGRFFAR